MILFVVNRAKNVKYEKSFIAQSIMLWNKLSQALKCTQDVKLFKTRVKSEIMQCKLNFPE